MLRRWWWRWWGDRVRSRSCAPGVVVTPIDTAVASIAPQHSVPVKHTKKKKRVVSVPVSVGMQVLSHHWKDAYRVVSLEEGRGRGGGGGREGGS